MPPRSDPPLDAAMAVAVGRRERQEDAVLCDCPLGADLGLVVLSDGMGGYDCGDVASKIVVTEVYSDLKLRAGELARAGADCAAILRGAAEGANECLRAYVEERPEAAGMGATLVAGILRAGALHWISIGDSALYLFRAGELVRLNEDHSFGSVMQAMVAEGRMEAAAAECHPDRTSLTSVLSGGPVARIDCPATPCELEEGDVLVFASDGLSHLDETAIARSLRLGAGGPAAELAAGLMRAVESLDDPEQDNVALALVRLGATLPAETDLRRRVSSVIAGALEESPAPARGAELCGTAGDGPR